MSRSSRPAGGPEVGRSASSRIWYLVASGVLALGIGLSGTGALLWHGYVVSHAHTQFNSKAASIAATVASQLSRDEDALAIQQAEVVAHPDLTNRELSVWYSAMGIQQRYPNSRGMGYLEIVSAAQLPSFGKRLLADPLVNQTSLAPYVVFPTGNRPRYCLQRFGINIGAQALITPATFDFCSLSIPGIIRLSPLPGLLDAATASGRPSILTLNAFATLPAAASLSDLFLILSPVYATAQTPTSVAARESSIRGWAMGTFSGAALVSSSNAVSAGLGVALFFGWNGPGTTAVVSSGTPRSGGDFASSFSVGDVGAWTVRVVGSSRTTAWPQAVGIGALGMVVSLLLFLLVILLTRSRASALRLVDKRTAQLRHQALHDGLTGLPNRTLILDRAEQMLLRARRQPPAACALFIDLDHFKEINDTFGHPVGDQLLKAVALRFSETLRGGDSVGRLGGDEFVVLVETDIGGAGPELVAERLLAAVEEPFHLEGCAIETLSIGASIGIAVGDRDSASDLLRDADVALYQAKLQGRRTYVAFRPEMQSVMKDRLELQLDLRHAVAKEELRVLYQPTFDRNSMTLKGVEALLRWHHPSRGDIPSETVIDSAQDSGLLVAIDRFVLNQACRQAAAWHFMGCRVPVSVSLSAKQLQRPGLVEDVREALVAAGLDAEWLILEVHEGIVMTDTDRVVTQLRMLKTLGVGVAIYGFGTGYGSLADLQPLRVDVLKIDSAVASPSMDALVHLGKSLGVETLVQVVDPNEQFESADAQAFFSHQGLYPTSSAEKWPLAPTAGGSG